MTIYESSSKHNILMYKTFFSFSISHCMVSALIDCLQRPNTSLPPLNTRSIPTSADGNWKEIPHRLSYQGVCKRVHFPPLQYPFRRSLMGPTHRWRLDIFVDIRSNDRLGRLDFAECLSYRLRHSWWTPRLCWDGSLKWVLLEEGSHFTDDVFGVRFAHLCCKESGLDVNILQWD